MSMKKASKGKRGCLTRAGKLKKGWRWAKGRKGHCVHAKKKAAPKKARKSAKRSAAARKAAATRKARAAERMLAAEGQMVIGSRAMDGW